MIIEIRKYYKAKDVVLMFAKPGNERRSLLGMIGTRGEYCIVYWAEKKLRKECPEVFPTVSYFNSI